MKLLRWIGRAILAFGDRVMGGLISDEETSR